MVYRVYSEKKSGLDNEAMSLLGELRGFLSIESLEAVRILNRYDVENIGEELFGYCVKTVFSEPQLDSVSYEITDVTEKDKVFAVEYLPGQFDQRASSAEQCIQLISKGEKPTVKSAKVYILSGDLSESDIAAVKKYVINPVESREASLEKPETLANVYKTPEKVKTLTGFTSLADGDLCGFIKEYGLAMDEGDLAFFRDYFKSEDRDPTITELRMVDTYWSDHCRHTTFLTSIDSVEFSDPIHEKAYREYLAARKELGRESKPINLMDIATIAAKLLKKEGKLPDLDESEEINACTVKIKAEFDGKKENWLLLFKNETHNHPTEIEPFGGAATCIGGAIRDPLSGRAYVYSAMRVTGAGNPLTPISETIPGKLPQRKIVTTAASGYSSYGNQIGLATGLVDEIYHDGYVAKRLEIGAVVGAVPTENVRREVPAPGDVVILLGGRTGRDGCGGATGSSKSHTVKSLDTCGAEVQKGNAPEERKLQRLFRNKEASLLIKRCNDFGAGGVSVAIGELADGLEINLDAVPKKYEGLDGTELAISESQERMAVVVEPKDAKRFCELADAENLEATAVAVVTENPYLVMRKDGDVIVNISREFLNSNGAQKHTAVAPSKPGSFSKETDGSFSSLYEALASDLNVCSKRGLSERFDSTIGAGSVLMPFGGKYQLTPSQVMANLISDEKRTSSTCSVMAYGYNPFITEKSPYHGAYLAVVESVSKLIASGTSFEKIFLTFQEYFEKPNHAPSRWGKPFAALLGAFAAQKALGIAAIGGKDSMSGSFENIDVPPTLVSFAVTTDEVKNIISPEFKAAGHKVILLKPEYNKDGLPDTDSLMSVYEKTMSLIRSGDALSVYTPTYGGIAEAVLKMCMGNKVGFRYGNSLSLGDIFGYCYGSFVIELADTAQVAECGIIIGETTETESIVLGGEEIPFGKIFAEYESKLENVYPVNAKESANEAPTLFACTAKCRISPAVKCASPTMLIPVFPGTNCEYDTAKAAERAGFKADIFVINNLTPSAVARSVEAFADKIGKSQSVFIPGGFSGGDEPDGSGKFITAFFRNPEVKAAVTELLERRDGLMGGICNGFQALIKLGLVPYGKIIDTDESCPTLTYNVIGRHQSKLVRTAVCSAKSPWMKKASVGEIYTAPISHGEGRFLADEALIRHLAENGQILTQYVDFDGIPTYDISFNPNGSAFAIEGITSPDGRVFGKMAHSERVAPGLYKNVPGNFDMGLFESAYEYFTK